MATTSSYWHRRLVHVCSSPNNHARCRLRYNGVDLPSPCHGPSWCRPARGANVSVPFGILTSSLLLPFVLNNLPLPRPNSVCHVAVVSSPRNWFRRTLRLPSHLPFSLYRPPASAIRAAAPAPHFSHQRAACMLHPVHICLSRLLLPRRPSPLQGRTLGSPFRVVIQHDVTLIRSLPCCISL